MKPRCACCGREVDDTLSIDEIIVAAALSPREAAILEFIAKAAGRYVTSWKIVEAVFADHHDGGPNNPSQSISQHAARINRKIAAVQDRLKIQASQHGFRFVSIETKLSQYGGFGIINQRKGAVQ